MNFIPPSDRDISKGQPDGLTARSVSLATLAKLAECSPDAMAVTDGRGEIIWVNYQTEKMFGYTRDDLLGQPVGFLVPDRSREIILALVVDLSDVTFVDEEAKRLLKRIIERAGKLRANDVMTKAIIEEVQRKPPET